MTDDTAALIPSDPALVPLEGIPALCAAVEWEALASDDVPFVEELYARMSALAEYAAVTSKGGQAKLQATRLRLLARIAELTPPTPGKRSDLTSTSGGKGSDPDPILSPQDMTRARKLAANPDELEVDLEDGDRRWRGSLQELIRGWTGLEGLSHTPRRDVILNGLHEHTRIKVLEIEEIYLRGKANTQ
jgi:hypothetical protein